MQFANGVTLSVSVRYAGTEFDGTEAEYAEVMAWDRDGDTIDLSGYTGRIDVSDVLELMRKLEHPDLMKCQDCEADIKDADKTCPHCGEGLSHPWCLLI